MTRPSFTITITADDGLTEIDVRVWSEPSDRQVGILEVQFEFEPEEPKRTLTATEERRALKAARSWAVTASHLPYSGPDVQILTGVPRSARRAQRRLLALRGELGSWAAVGREVEQDKGLLRRVGLGRQKAPPAVVGALYPPNAPKPDYAPWRAAHLPLLERMVAWAETPKGRRGVWER